MRNKRIMVILIVLSLLATLTASASASSNLYPATPNIAGVWHTSVKIESLPESFNALWSFSDDGNFLDINTYRETNPGVWIGSGNTYVLTFWGFFYDEQGKNFGKARVSVVIHMDDADHFTADGMTNGFDLEGKPMGNEFEGPVHLTGERMQIELPQLEAKP